MGDGMGITNTRQLSEELSIKLETAINEISENMYNALIDCIEETIYISDDSEWYKRRGYNGGFIGAFKLSDLKKMSNSVTRTLFYDWASMSLNGNSGYTHGNEITYKDRRKDLWWILDTSMDNIINSDFGGALGMRDSGSVGYLELFNAILIRDFDKWVNDALKKQGLYLVK